VPKEIRNEVNVYLESFSQIKMQEMAAKVVYLTCRLQTKEAKRTYLAEESQDHESDDEYEDESGDDPGEGKEEEPLEEPDKPMNG
jgi:hypothetical protein